MFNHVMVGADDVAAAKSFYDAILGALDHAPEIWMTRADVFTLPPQAFSPSRLQLIESPLRARMGAPSVLLLLPQLRRMLGMPLA